LVWFDKIRPLTLHCAYEVKYPIFNLTKDGQDLRMMMLPKGEIKSCERNGISYLLELVRDVEALPKAQESLPNLVRNKNIPLLVRLNLLVQSVTTPTGIDDNTIASQLIIDLILNRGNGLLNELLDVVDRTRRYTQIAKLSDGYRIPLLVVAAALGRIEFLQSAIPGSEFGSNPSDANFSLGLADPHSSGTPLHWALCNQQPEACEFLLSKHEGAKSFQETRPFTPRLNIAILLVVVEEENLLNINNLNRNPNQQLSVATNQVPKYEIKITSFNNHIPLRKNIQVLHVQSYLCFRLDFEKLQRLFALTAGNSGKPTSNITNGYYVIAGLHHLISKNNLAPGNPERAAAVERAIACLDYIKTCEHLAGNGISFELEQLTHLSSTALIVIYFNLPEIFNWLLDNKLCRILKMEDEVTAQKYQMFMPIQILEKEIHDAKKKAHFWPRYARDQEWSLHRWRQIDILSFAIAGKHHWAVERILSHTKKNRALLITAPDFPMLHKHLRITNEPRWLAQPLKLHQQTTPLHFASALGDNRSCQLLLKHGLSAASTHANNNETPIYFARQSGHKAIEKRLTPLSPGIRSFTLYHTPKRPVQIFVKYDSSNNDRWNHKRCRTNLDRVVRVIEHGYTQHGTGTKKGKHNYRAAKNVVATLKNNRTQYNTPETLFRFLKSEHNKLEGQHKSGYVNCLKFCLAKLDKQIHQNSAEQSYRFSG